MATSQPWNQIAESKSPLRDVSSASKPGQVRGMVLLWMMADVWTIVLAGMVAIYSRLQTGPLAQARNVWKGTLFQGWSMGGLLGLLLGFGGVLILTSRRMHLYEPKRITSFLHEQRLSAQACLTSGLLLTGALYLVHGGDIPRSIVLLTVVLVMAGLGLRRLIYRLLLYRRFDRGVGTRNVLIVGTGQEAQALRRHLQTLRYLGYTFKGFVEAPGFGGDSRPAPTGEPAGEVVGTLGTLFESVRKHFVDEILVTARCDRGTIEEVLDQARERGVDLRVVPDLYDGLAWNSPVEYIGQFPTIPLHYGAVPELSLLIKRGVDLVFSMLTLGFLSPLFAVIAVAVKLDSRGPVFYLSERIGKKGHVFRCVKFRTMVADAERRKAELLHKNERDGVLFKMTDDPRITRVGRFLRKYSLDELPQFWNVLKGEMSVVGPRPPLASEVKEYKLSHLRRLDVTPGITGLWQVQGRRDPSFASYVSMDVTYIDNWSVWLDFQIIVRTIGVMLAGTGS